MPRIVLYVFPVVLAVYAFVDCVLDRGRPAPYAPRWVWLIAIVILPVAGPIAWLVAAHLFAPPSGSRPATRTWAPDDDPEFLRGLGAPGEQPPERDNDRP